MHWKKCKMNYWKNMYLRAPYVIETAKGYGALFYNYSV
jgi:hypothetical protein